MFLKILLVLAVCFQEIFCYQNNETNYYGKVPGALEVGKVLKVHVWDPVLYPEFLVRLFRYKFSYAGHYVDTDIDVWISRKTGDIRVYWLKEGKRHNEHFFYCGNPNSSHNITVQVLMEKNYFDVIACGKQFYLYHPTPVPRISAFDITYTEVYKIHTHVWERQFVPCPCGLQKTYVPK